MKTRSLRVSVATATAALLVSSAANAAGSASGWGYCTDSCHVVGYLKCGQYRCRTFGTWDSSRMPRLNVSLELSSRFFPVQGWSVSGVRGKVSAPMDSGVFDGSHVVATPIGMRIGGYLTGPLYTGLHLGIDPAFRYGGDSRPPDAIRLTSTTGLYAEVALALEVAIPVRNVTLRGELLSDGRLMSFGATDPKTTTEQTSSAYLSASAATWMLQPRVAADLWVSPWSTVGIFAGTDVLHKSEYILGLSFGFHLRAFEGARDPL
jgi:hypothetical protein